MKRTYSYATPLSDSTIFQRDSSFLWLLAALLCLPARRLVALLRYFDRSVRLEARNFSWRERAEDRTQMLQIAEEVLAESLPASVRSPRNSENTNLAETPRIQHQQARHDLETRKQAIESPPAGERLLVGPSPAWEKKGARGRLCADLQKPRYASILSGNEALKNEPDLPRPCTTTTPGRPVGRTRSPRGGTRGHGGILRFTTHLICSRECNPPDMVIHLPRRAPSSLTPVPMTAHPSMQIRTAAKELG